MSRISSCPPPVRAKTKFKPVLRCVWRRLAYDIITVQARGRRVVVIEAQAIRARSSVRFVVVYSGLFGALLSHTLPPFVRSLLVLSLVCRRNSKYLIGFFFLKRKIFFAFNLLKTCYWRPMNRRPSMNGTSCSPGTLCIIPKASWPTFCIFYCPSTFI